MQNTKAQKTNSEANQKNATAGSNDQTVEVLYQKMGDRWFAFSLIDDEVFVGSISPEELASKKNKSAKVHRKTGNS